MAHTYRVKNTFVDHPESDDEVPTMKRSNSWTGSSLTSLSISSGTPCALAASSSSHPRFSNDLFVLNESRPSDIQNDAPSQLTRAPMLENGKDDVRHIVFDLDSLDSSGHCPDSTASSEQLTSSRLSPATPNASSRMHDQMHCGPCLRFILKEQCKDGGACNFCHLDHTSERLRQRPSKSARDKVKRIIQDVFDLHSGEDDKDKRLDQLQLLIQPQNPFLRRLLVQKIADWEEPPALLPDGQINRRGPLHQLDHSPDDETEQTPTARQQMEHHSSNTKKQMDLFRHSGKAQSKDAMKHVAQLALVNAMKNVAQPARGGEASEGQSGKPVAVAREVAGLESSAPLLSEPGLVLNASPPGRSKVSL